MRQNLSNHFLAYCVDVGGFPHRTLLCSTERKDDNAAFKSFPAVSRVFLQAIGNHFVKFDADTFLILPGSTNGRFSDNNQDSYPFLKWFLSGLLTEMSRSCSYPVKPNAYTCKQRQLHHYCHRQQLLLTCHFKNIPVLEMVTCKLWVLQ